MSYIEDEPPPVLLPCAICSRTFRPEILERHVKVCEKTASKKRRVFDSFKNRVSGTELEEFLGPAPLPGQIQKRPVKSPVKKRAPSKWKETHENLIAVLRAARGVEPPPDAVVEFPKHGGNEQCPSCNRFFGPRAFDRHVEFCKEKTARIKMTPSKMSQAQERLEARTKYRAPLSIKPKLTTKEKYSPMLPRKESVESCAVSTSSKTSPPIPTLSRNAKPVKQTSNFSRQSPIRSSERQRSISPMKKSVVSNSKYNVRNEAHSKVSNQPKIKERLKSPEDLRPKTGTKLTTQEKIRSSNLKLEDESIIRLSKLSKKKREKPIRSNLPSDDESTGTMESESDKHAKQNPMRSRWSSAESITRSVVKPVIRHRTAEEDEKETQEMGKDEMEKFKSKTRDLKTGRKNSKVQKPQINDLSVNDESFGIFVAACSVRPPSTNLKVRESPERPKCQTKSGKLNKHDAEVKINERVEKSPVKRKTEPEVLRSLSPSLPPQISREEKTEESVSPRKVNQRTKKPVSRIPKLDKFSKKIEKSVPIEIISPVEPLIPESIPDRIEDAPETIKKNAKKWRNISEMSTEELVSMSEDFDVPEYDTSHELSDSAIWEIAAEQFLQSEDSALSTSLISVDSLNEVEKKNSGGDDFIVLHVADPAKMLENDPDMKLSVSEPCFPYSEVLKPKEKASENVKLDIAVFAAFPNAIQSKLTHRKRKSQKKRKKPKPTPKLPHIREKTFLANDFPKVKRRKTGEEETVLSHYLSNHFFENASKEELDERKKSFIEKLKYQRQKIRKWQITANSHIRFMEKFEKSIEDDLKELKNLSRGKKTRRKSYLSEFKKEKMKEMKREEGKIRKPDMTEMKVGPKVKKFEYFEISLDDDKPDEETRVNCLEDSGNKVDKSEEQIVDKIPLSRKFECFEIPTLDFTNKKKRGNTDEASPDTLNFIYDKEDTKVENESPKKYKGNTVENENVQDVKADQEYIQGLNHQNSSLENIEEVDEEEERNSEPEKNYKKGIEIEDFIISKPNTQKILAKDENCLDQLFPKPRKITETVTPAESVTAVQLSFTADSVYDLKRKEEKSPKPLPQIPVRNNSTRILQKRVKKGSRLPQILVKDSEKKENSMLSLLELWQNKRSNLESEKVYKIKAALPTGKLAPLTNKNSFQIAVLPFVLKQKLSEIMNDRLLDGDGSNDSYDPFKKAERQMLALLSWPSTADIKSTKDLSPKPKTPTQQKTNLETSPTSAFTKYPNKDDKSDKNNKPGLAGKKNINETFEVNDTAKKNSRNEKPMYTAADDWEEIFEKHFDLNRNEMSEQMTKSVKSALDGLLKNSLKNNSNTSGNLLATPKSKTDLTEESIITEVLYTSTPKQSSKSEKSPKTRSKDNAVDLDRTQNTYRKNSNFTYGRITPPEDFNDAYDKGKREEKTNRNSGISLSSLSFCSQISDTTLADEEVMRSNLEIIGKAAAAAASRTPRRKYARSQSVFDERNKMLFAKTYDPNCTSSDENDVDVLPKIVDKSGKKSPSRNPYPKSFPSPFSRSQSVMEDRCKGDGDHSDDGDHVSSPESNRNRKAKLSGDSAYSSLNRRSPRKNVLQNQQEDRLSSSGSEHSLPAVNTDFDSKLKSVDKSTPKKDQPVKMSKFCHECGSKYPVAIAKFCCECGVRRLVI